MWEHPHAITPLSSILSPVSPQLSFLCLVTNPCTDPDKGRLTITAYSVLRFSSQQDPPLSILWFTRQISLQLLLHFTSEQLSLTSVSAPRFSNQPPLPITAKHCVTPASLSNSASKTALLGPQQTEPYSVFWGPKRVRFTLLAKRLWPQQTEGHSVCWVLKRAVLFAE